MTPRWMHLILLIWLTLAAAAVGADYSHGLLWQVESAGGEPSFVFGTIHVDDPRVVTLPPPVEEAFSRSHDYVMELVPDLSSIGALGQAMIYQDGGDLESDIGSDLYQRTVQALAGIGVPAPAVRRMKPWAALLTLSMPQTTGGQILDLDLYTRAVTTGKAVHGLESVAEQVAVFADLPLQDQATLLRETLDALETVQSVNAQLVQVYLDRDLKAMLDINEESLAGGDPDISDSVNRRLIVDRNRRMMARMAPMLDQGGAFIAIGALHLPGEYGILRLLSDRGYTVRKVY